ncbi:hypothetical protein CPC08DRAFT_763776 [Agrocybe pediades]|nr:hypothetical protein CPC08DRAFT_763776 [Agrocybe pediades]
MSSESDDDYEYTEIKRGKAKSRPRKRQKRIKNEDDSETTPARSTFSVEPLLSALWANCKLEGGDGGFEQVIDPLIPDLLQARDAVERSQIELDDDQQITRPVRSSEIASLVAELSAREVLSSSEALILRKLKLEAQRKNKPPEISAPQTPLNPLPAVVTPQVDPEVLNALYAIKTTPFLNSFLSRLHGTKEFMPPGLISVDWETRTPWMNLMEDIREHYTFAHPEREMPVESLGPITYSTLHAYQLPQVHDLLERSFWPGIDVTDSLDYQPEKSTIIAMYKKVVVGVAIITSPIQTYITYLAVKAGWDKAQIARTMLYHLIMMHPNKDFTLHVSTNNSAMLLYNQFGFKAEEFVAGFYSEYLPPDSRASKNAFRLRLRHL